MVKKITLPGERGEEKPDGEQPREKKMVYEIDVGESPYWVVVMGNGKEA